VDSVDMDADAVGWAAGPCIPYVGRGACLPRTQAEP
jgi:hypothetical protein